MILWDRCDLWTYRVAADSPGVVLLAAIPCQVSALDSIRTMDDGAPWAIETTVRAILPAGLPIEIKPSGTGGHEIVWRHWSWQIVGQPSWRRIHGRDHHQTVELFRKAYSGS